MGRNGNSLMGMVWEWELVTKLGMGMGMGRNGNGLHVNGREWEYEKPFPVISSLELWSLAFEARLLLNLQWMSSAYFKSKRTAAVSRTAFLYLLCCVYLEIWSKAIIFKNCSGWSDALRSLPVCYEDDFQYDDAILAKISIYWKLLSTNSCINSVAL